MNAPRANLRYAVLRVPDFALHALRRDAPELAGRPVALIRGEGRKAVIAAASTEAAGLEPGLAVTLAMARCPGVVLRPPNPVAEISAQRLLLAAAFTLSPRVELTTAGCCTIDLQGADRPATESRLQRCLAELAAAGLPARAGIAPTPLLADYAARTASPVCFIDDTAAFLAPLPLSFADPTPAQEEILHGWGIRTLGALAALSKAEIGLRLGTEGVRLWERAAGETERVLHLTAPARSFATEWTYEPPVESMEPLLFRLRRFAECLALELRGAGLAAEKLALTLLLEDESDYRREFRLPEPGTDVDGWLRVLHGHLETVRTPARVTAVRLAATAARPPEKQDGLFDTGLRDPATFWENLARVAALLGENGVGTPAPADTWRPDAFTLERPVECVPAPREPPAHAPTGLALRRFRPPWPVEVECREGQPVSLSGPELRGLVAAARGPWRSEGDWWTLQPWAVETWHIEVPPAGLYQLARTGGSWCVEGMLD
ncbi:MAG TPA: DNA polymerase Y family protein [Candidatus Didemnitutus sp.]|nr:DNA polymerase Y family protein [Candidatus Didemnitutus sp.]